MSELMFALAGIFDTLVIAIYFFGILKRMGTGYLCFNWCGVCNLVCYFILFVRLSFTDRSSNSQSSVAVFSFLCF